MKYKVTEQWRPNNNELCVLYLDNAKLITSASDDYRFYRIGGIVYKPVPMSHLKDKVKVIAIKGEGDFVGKEVEFIKEDT